MSAAPDILIRELAARGVCLSRRGDKLHVEAPRGILTEEIKETLTAHKPALLVALSGSVLRTRLVNLADKEAIDAALIECVPDNELTELQGLSDDTLRAYIHTLHDNDLRERGQRPNDETARALCRHCGPIWVGRSVAAVAPTIEGWARVLGCAWCHLRTGHPIPRPRVTCGTCRYFKRDTVNRSGGMGRCTVTRKRLPSEPLPHPFAERMCAEWRPASLENKP